MTACDKKQRYTTHAAALEVATQRVLAGRASHLRVYECRDCKGFHLTKQRASVPA